MNKLLLCVFTFCSISFGYSQEHVLSSGKDATATSGSVSYSVGLIHYKDAEGAGGTSSTGSQIAYEILTLSTNDVDNLVSLKLYPNPTSDVINIELAQNKSLQFSLIDLSGREIKSGSINELTTKIELSNFNASVYILNITENNKLLKSYKIIKK